MGGRVILPVELVLTPAQADEVERAAAKALAEGRRAFTLPCLQDHDAAGSLCAPREARRAACGCPRP